MKLSRRWYLILVIACLSQIPKAAAGPFKLYVGSFFGVDIEKDGAWSSAGVIPAFEMALEHVNNDNSILAGYTLEYIWRDSKCESGEAIRAMLDLVGNSSKPLVFLGPGCSVAAKPVAEAALYWNIVQIGFSTSSPLFSDKKKFPLYFRTSTSETMENPARVALLKYFKWDKVALLVQNLDIYVMTREKLIPSLKESNISVIATESFNDEPHSSVKYILKEKDARIIIALMYEDMFRKAMCTAYQENLYGYKYVWIIVGWYNDDWWLQKKDVECTGKQMKRVAANLIETLPLPLSSSTEPTVSNWTPKELNEEYERRIRKANLTLNMYSAFTYDAVWSLALMLNQSETALSRKNTSLRELPFGSKEASQMFARFLGRTDFSGMSGHVTFDSKGNRETLVQITHNKYGRRIAVGTYNAYTSTLELFNKSFEWEGGRVPRSGTIKKEKTSQDSQSTGIVFYVLSCSGILFCAFCLLLNFYYRRDRYIRMSSPQLNNITVVGCCMCYTEVLLTTFSNSSMVRHHTLLCQARCWILATAFTMAFGGILAKTFRVYKIFTNRQMKKELGSLTNNCLLLRLFLYWLVDVIILSVWMVVDPITTDLIGIETKSDNGDDDIIITMLAFQCTSRYFKSWILGFCCYKGILLIFGVFLAWETRNVQIPALNDSKNIGLAAYNIFMFSSLAIVTEFLATDFSTRTLFGRIIVFVGTTSTICLMFVPKILHILRSGRVGDVTGATTTSAPERVQNAPSVLAESMGTQQAL